MYYFIVNPAAGHGRFRSLQGKIRSRLEHRKIQGEWAMTTGQGDATKLAKAAVDAGYTTIVAIGGDDTVNEVINGVESDHVAVGIIPIGSGNRLANQLGILGWQQACEVVSARRLTTYSLIAAGQKYFLSTLTLGFGTELDKAVDTEGTGLRARAMQFGQSLGKARTYQSLHAKLDVDNRFKIECDLFTLSISNQKFLNPLADNRLIVTISNRPEARLQLGSLVWQTLRDRHAGGPEDDPTTRFLADRVVIETDPPAGLMVDGKLASRTPIAIRLTDRSVRLITEKIMGDFKQAVTLRG